MMDMDQNDDDDEEEDDDNNDDDDDEEEEEEDDEDDEEDACILFMHFPVKVGRTDHKRSWKNFGVWLTLYHYTPLKTNMSP